MSLSQLCPTLRNPAYKAFWLLPRCFAYWTRYKMSDLNALTPNHSYITLSWVTEPSEHVKILDYSSKKRLSWFKWTSTRAVILGLGRILEVCLKTARPIRLNTTTLAKRCSYAVGQTRVLGIVWSLISLNIYSNINSSSFIRVQGASKRHHDLSLFTTQPHVSPSSYKVFRQ